MYDGYVLKIYRELLVYIYIVLSLKRTNAQAISLAGIETTLTRRIRSPAVIGIRHIYHILSVTSDNLYSSTSTHSNHQ